MRSQGWLPLELPLRVLDVFRHNLDDRREDLYLFRRHPVSVWKSPLRVQALVGVRHTEQPLFLQE